MNEVLFCHQYNMESIYDIASALKVKLQGQINVVVNSKDNGVNQCEPVVHTLCVGCVPNISSI